MQEGLILALLITFIVICITGLIVYATFFAIHKIFFRREIKLIKKFNEIFNGLSGINIFKIQVLAKNDLGNELELDKYITIYRQLKANLTIIKNNIDIADAELNAFNLKVAKKCMDSIDRDLTKSLKEWTELKQAYTQYTSYGNSIESAFQNYLDIFESLTNFYFNKFNYIEDFTKVNDLIETIRKTFISIPRLSNEFDYKKTIDTIIDLGKKLRTLSNILITIYRFQAVDIYLKTSKEMNQKMIDECHNEIERGDLQTLHNLLTVFIHAYNNFNKAYRKLQLAEAKSFAFQAIKAINQINQFTYVHIKTPALINLGVNEIKEQTDKIIANKQDIINSMADLKQYFVLEPKVVDCFDVIEKNIGEINILNNAANNVNYKTHNEKIRAIKDLDAMGNQIVTKKEEIIQAIDYINDMLGKIIKTVTDLNDLYIYFWQLFVTVKQYMPSGPDSTSIQQLIKSNLKQLEEYSKQIVEKEKPDFDQIAYEIGAIVEQSLQIYKQMTSTVTLKTYASKLFVYANRYKKNKNLQDKFELANKEFKAKNYAICIDTLLDIIKTAKKAKN